MVLFLAFDYWKGEFLVAGLWALIFRFSVYKEASFSAFAWNKTNTKVLQDMANLSYSDFLLTLFAILPKFLDKGIRQELTN